MIRPQSLLTALVLATAALAIPSAAQAAGETVNVWLPSTSDSAGRVVTRGLQQQSPIAFVAGNGAGITVDENRTFQQFEGAGASFTDTAAWLMNSSGALSATTREDTMRRLFDPNTGIGLSFLRSPMGASDLARFNYTYDDTCCDLGDFSIGHDLADVLPLTRQARNINPAVTVMATPWTAPAWMKDNNSFSQGWLQAQYYDAYAQYFAKFLQAYQSQGVPIDYVSAQNEPTCCAGYPSMNWNDSGLDFFTVHSLYPALHSANLRTKVLVLDWNWSAWNGFGASQVADAALRNDPNFGGIAWHGYDGDVGTQTAIHNQFPSVDAFATEHSGGTWIGNPPTEDMHTT